MSEWISLALHYEDGSEESLILQLPCVVGKQAACDLRIRSWRVAKKHLEFYVKPSGVYIRDLGSLQGSFLNAEHVYGSQKINLGDEIIVGPCKMRVLDIQIQALLTDEQVSSPVAEEVTCTPTSHLALRDTLSHLLRTDMDLQTLNSVNDDCLRQEGKRVLEKYMLQYGAHLPLEAQSVLVEDILAEVFGLGVLESLLADDDVSEIMVNYFDRIYVERQGKLFQTGLKFSSEEALRGVIDRIVAPIGRHINESSPMVDARLPDGSRLNAVLAPIALKGTNLTIRKFSRQRLAIEDLIANQSLNQAMADFLAYLIVHKKNIILSGGTGSGKTTLLNILSNFIPDDERLITIEDAAELHLHHTNLISLEARPANTEGQGLISIRSLVKNALRMRPDRIIVGECRGEEAFDMLTAMNTGHEGSLTTLHANSPRDALSRLESMVLLSGVALPLLTIREQISASVDFIVQQNRLSNGRRVITSITEVCGMEGNMIKTQEIFSYRDNEGFVSTGIVPDHFSRQSNNQYDLSWFVDSEMARSQIHYLS